MIRSRIAIAALLLFSVSWLIVNHQRPWTSFHSEFIAFLALFFFASSQIRCSSKQLTPQLIGWIMLVCFLSIVQLLTNLILFTGDTLITCFYLTGLMIAIIVGYHMNERVDDNSPEMAIRLAHSIWIAALISAFVGLLQWLDITELQGTYTVQTESNARAAGNLAQPNHLATLLLMGIVSLVYIYENKVIGNTSLTLAISVLTLVLVLTQSRAGMASALIVVAFILIKHNARNLRLPKRAIFWWIVIFFLATLSLPSTSDWLSLGSSRGLISTSSINERWLIWRQVASSICQSPWFGYGWNQTHVANAVGALVYPGSSTYTNAHNIVLDLMVWCGIPLGLFLTGLMVYWFISRLRAIQTPTAILAMAGLLPITVHSLFEYPFAYAYFLIAAGFFIGIIETDYRSARVIAINVRWLWLILMVWATIGGYTTYEYLQVEEDFRIVRFQNLRIGTTPPTYEIPHILMLSHMAAMLQAARQTPKPGMSQAELENLRRVSNRFAYGAIRFKYMLALALNDDPTGASKQLQIIYSMYGDFFYKSCKNELQRLSIEEYPELARVKIPG